MNDAEKQLQKVLRTTSFNNAAVAERLQAIAVALPEMGRELRALASRLERESEMLEGFIKEIRDGRITRLP